MNLRLVPLGLGLSLALAGAPAVAAPTPTPGASPASPAASASPSPAAATRTSTSNPAPTARPAAPTTGAAPSPSATPTPSVTPTPTPAPASPRAGVPYVVGGSTWVVDGPVLEHYTQLGREQGPGASPVPAATPSSGARRTPAAPAPTAAGPLDERSLPRTIAGFSATTAEAREGEFVPNGSWVHAVDTDVAGREAMPLCGTGPTPPQPRFALAAAYAGQRAEPGNGLVLQFADAGAARA